jgi:hypothetical protein
MSIFDKITNQKGLITFAGLMSTNRIKTVRDANDTILELGGSYSTSGVWTGMQLSTPTINGLTASGSADNNFSGSAGNFYTSSGFNILKGAVTVDAASPTIELPAGKTITGFYQVSGKNSGGLRITSVDTANQLLTLNLAAQTVGNSILTIPNTFGVNKTVAWLESPTFTGTVGFSQLIGTGLINTSGNISSTGGLTVCAQLNAGNALISCQNYDTTATSKAIVESVSGANGTDGGDALFTFKSESTLKAGSIGLNKATGKINFTTTYNDVTASPYMQVDATTDNIQINNTLNLNNLTASTSLRLDASKNIESVNGGMQLIERQTFAVDTATTNFIIPAGFQSLRIIASGRTTTVGTIGSIIMRFNNDTGANYDWQFSRVTNGVSTPGQTLGSTFIILADLPGTTGTAGYAGSAAWDIPNYAQTTYNKSLFSINTAMSNVGANSITSVWGADWRNSAAITSIQFSVSGASIKAGTSISIYGLY